MEDSNETKEQREVELDEINVIMKIPKDSARIDITAYLIDDNGDVSKVSKTMKAGDIYEMRKDFLDNVEDGDDYDARYVITEEGLEFLEQLEKQRNDKIHCVCD